MSNNIVPSTIQGLLSKNCLKIANIQRKLVWDKSHIENIIQELIENKLFLSSIYYKDEVDDWGGRLVLFMMGYNEYQHCFWLQKLF